jgi:argininosuccinate synthase
MGRVEEIAYAAAHGIEVAATAASPYSVDANLWGRSVECGPLEDPWTDPPEDVFAWTANPAITAARGEELTIAFERGIPVSLDGQRLPAEELVLRVSTVAGRNGVGRIDHVENRLVGIKSREVYEAPAAVVLHAAHSGLETVALPRDVAHLKAQLSGEWARLVYDGLWFGALRNALGAFVASTQEHVTGEVRVRCARGLVTVTGRRAERSLYSPSLATYDREADTFDHGAARGFIELFGLPLRNQARVQGALEDLAPLSLPRQVRRAP